MGLFSVRVKKQHVAIFLENMSFLLGCGYTAYDAAVWIVSSSDVKKRDKEARAVKEVGNTILHDLNEGYALSTAMLRNPKYFGAYAKQIEAAEESGQVAEVLDQIVNNIKESGDLTQKIKSAMTYPAIVLTATVGIAWYLFSFVIPDIIKMLDDVGGGDETPAMTLVVMAITEWMKKYAIWTLLAMIAIVSILIYLSRGPMKRQFAKLYTVIPFISKITLSANVTSWMQSMRYMLAAGSPMANALLTSADTMTNIYMRDQAREAYLLFATSGVAVYESLKRCTFFTAMELGTINIGLESGQIVEVLGRLSARRKADAEKAIAAFIAALNPVVIMILGGVVGVIVMAVYGPLINITSTMNNI